MLKVFKLKSDVAVCFDDDVTKVEFRKAAAVLLNESIEYLEDTHLLDVPFGFTAMDTLYIGFNSYLNGFDKLTL